MPNARPYVPRLDVESLCRQRAERDAAVARARKMPPRSFGLSKVATLLLVELRAFLQDVYGQDLTYSQAVEMAARYFAECRPDMAWYRHYEFWTARGRPKKNRADFAEDRRYEAWEAEQREKAAGAFSDESVDPLSEVSIFDPHGRDEDPTLSESGPRGGAGRRDGDADDAQPGAPV